MDLNGNDWHFSFYTTFAFFTGAVTSTFSGYVGMKVGTYANVRTAYEAQSSLGKGFSLAFRAGNVMGFFLTSLGVLVLTVLIIVYA